MRGSTLALPASGSPLDRIFRKETAIAIYRLSAQVISRSAGRSATAAAAYRAGAVIEDRRTGQVHDYARRGGVVHEEIIAPENTPEWMKDRDALWNAVERAEKRKDAQLSREVQLALPHELSAAQRLALVRDFVSREFVARGMIADLVLHEPHRQGDERNHHAHVMLTLREITADGFGNKNRSWNAREAIEQWRETWAEAVNRELERAGHEQRVDHRTLELQRAEAAAKAEQARAANDNRTAHVMEFEAARLDRDPEPKIGHIAMALERRGERTARGDIWREVVACNLDRFRDWLALQRTRLEILWERGRQAAVRHRRQTQDGREASERPAPPGSAPFTQEQRDRLMGRASKERPSDERAAGRDRDGRER